MILLEFLRDILVNKIYYTLGKGFLMLITGRKFPNESTSTPKKVFIIYLAGIIFYSFLFLIIFLVDKNQILKGIEFTPSFPISRDCVKTLFIIPYKNISTLLFFCFFSPLKAFQ